MTTNPAGASAENIRLRELVGQVATGDRRAFDSLVTATGPMVNGRALSILRDRGLAEEVAQTVFLKVWRNAQKFDAQRGSVPAWLNILTRSTSIDRLRVEERHTRNAKAAVAAIPRPSRDEVEDNVQRNSRSEELRETLSQLVPDQRIAIELAYFDGLTYVEVAARLGVPEGTIKARIRRGMKQLSQLLGERDE